MNLVHLLLFDLSEISGVARLLNLEEMQMNQTFGQIELSAQY